MQTGSCCGALQISSYQHIRPCPLVILSVFLCVTHTYMLKHTHTHTYMLKHTHTIRLVLKSTLFLGWCPRPALWHWLMSTWCVNMTVLLVEVTDRFHRLHLSAASKTKNPMLCHCHIATPCLPPDWLMPLHLVLAYIKSDMLGQWPHFCPEFIMFAWVIK